MSFSKILNLFILLSLILLNPLQAETLTFGSSIYEGEVKKSKAYGQGVLTFADESTYEGKFKKNKPHGMGTYTDPRENSYEGKWRYGKLKVKMDKKTRRIIKLSVEEGQSNYFEIKGTGQLVSEWFEAEQNSDGVFALTKKGKRDMETKKRQALESSNSSGSGSGSGSGGSS
jgi:hypothetical protein